MTREIHPVCASEDSVLWRHLPRWVRRFGAVPENTASWRAPELWPAGGLAKPRALAAPCAPDSALWGRRGVEGSRGGQDPGLSQEGPRGRSSGPRWEAEVHSEVWRPSSPALQVVGLGMTILYCFVFLFFDSFFLSPEQTYFQCNQRNSRLSSWFLPHFVFCTSI